MTTITQNGKYLWNFICNKENTVEGYKRRKSADYGVSEEEEIEKRKAAYKRKSSMQIGNSSGRQVTHSLY